MQCVAETLLNLLQASKQPPPPSFLFFSSFSSSSFPAGASCVVLYVRERERCAWRRLRRCRRFASTVVFRWTNYGWSATWLLYCAGRRESLSKNEMKWRRLPAAYTMALKGDNRRRFVLDLSGSICSCSNKKLIFDPTCNANIMHALVHIVRS